MMDLSPKKLKPGGGFKIKGYLSRWFYCIHATTPWNGIGGEGARGEGRVVSREVLPAVPAELTLECHTDLHTWPAGQNSARNTETQTRSQ